MVDNTRRHIYIDNKPVVCVCVYEYVHEYMYVEVYMRIFWYVYEYYLCMDTYVHCTYLSTCLRESRSVDMRMCLIVCCVYVHVCACMCCIALYCIVWHTALHCLQYAVLFYVVI